MLTALPSGSMWPPPLAVSPKGASNASGAGTSPLRPLPGSPAGAACILTPPEPVWDLRSAFFKQNVPRL